MQIRLQKIISTAGIASRRAAEKLIVEGRVSVNGETVRELGSKADPDVDEVRVDDRRIKGAQKLRYFLLNKPPGYVTTRSDPEKRPTVLDLLRGVHEYIYPVGRLDYDSEGLLILTNDGDLAAMLTHPRHEVERVYEAQVLGVPDAHDIDRLARGVAIDGRRTEPAEVELLGDGRRQQGKTAVLRITIHEGRTRQVRNMCDAIGHPVRALRRVRIGSLTDPKLKLGGYRELTPGEVARLKAAGKHTSRQASHSSRGPQSRPARNQTRSTGHKRAHRE
ncbi:MAG TPA: pseudouridine synthase [Vicinamibacterales bacterium]|jgi:pseudouridine synthase|nr:pseudouridine synthase [Vicinamibacterales bacterium]